MSSSSSVPLKHSWTWYFNQGQQRTRDCTVEQFESRIQKLGCFSTVQEFWCYNNALIEPSSFPQHSNLRLFKEDIKPTWEESANRNGGKLTVQLTKQETNQWWLRLLLAMIGEQFDRTGDICGIVLSIRPKNNFISIWNRDGHDRSNVLSIEDTVCRVLNLKTRKLITYKLHAVEESPDRLERTALTRSAPPAECSTAASSVHKRSSSNIHSPYSSPWVSRHRKANSDEAQPPCTADEAACAPIPLDLEAHVEIITDTDSAIDSTAEIVIEALLIVDRPTDSQASTCEPTAPAESAPTDAPNECQTKGAHEPSDGARRVVLATLSLSSSSSDKRHRKRWAGAALSFGLITVTTVASLLILSW